MKKLALPIIALVFAACSSANKTDHAVSSRIDKEKRIEGISTDATNFDNRVYSSVITAPVADTLTDTMPSDALREKAN